jgi:hypothetical protein
VNTLKTTFIASALALLATGMAATPAQASVDAKSLSPMRCQPLGPNTTIAELTINHNGIYNPGTTPETVTCELPMDSETAWAATPGNSGIVEVYYSTGSVSGKLACTMYVGSTQMQTTPVYSTSNAPPVSPPYSRAALVINLAYPSTNSGFGLVPIDLECIITPKATMAAIYFRESLSTNTP